MPTMVLNRNFALRSLAGRVIDFVKNEPIHVPPECQREALQIGAVGTDEQLNVLEAEALPEVPLSNDERREMLLAAFPELEAANDRESFTAQGVPNAAALKAIVGFDVAAKERDAAWTEYLQAKSDAAGEK